MGACLSAPKECGVEDAGKAGAARILVASSIGKEMPVIALPSDTMHDINRKIEAVHGVQPSVMSRKKYHRPQLRVYHDNEWKRIRWDAKVSDLREYAKVDKPKLKYCELSDEISVNFSHELGTYGLIA